tara:strand:- start:3421 stop:4740 length:1320 start_codon:yes stop_codon:yes gene_type:complete
MCGIQITFNKMQSGIAHRGVNQFSGNINEWNYHFASLPISSGKTTLTQPLDINSHSKLLFNGEIFNYKQFGNYLSDLHYLKDLFLVGIKNNKRFQKEYKKWDGFWSICIIDSEGVSFFTDPLGKKQLYYSTEGICSEIKPIDKDNILMNSPKFKTSNTCFQGVHRAMPGKFYYFHQDAKSPWSTLEHAKHYLWESIHKSNTSSDMSLIRTLIDKSVKTRSVINYGKLGLLFSGGLDSSIIAYHLIKNNIPFTAITIDNDEKDNAERISKYLGFDPIYISDELTPEEIDTAIKAYEHSLDYGSMLLQYKLFKKCKDLGLTTVLTGDGADELFSGYTRAQKEDTQEFDVMVELPYFHHIRIDRMSMINTIECRNPFLNTELVKYALSIPYELRKNKAILREAYRNEIPFVDVEKKPLRLKGDKEYNIKMINNKFKQLWKTN